MYFDVARTAIESLYSGRCTISIKSKQFNQTTKQTEFVDTVLIENQPCRLSYLNLYPSEGNVQRGSISNNVSSVLFQIMFLQKSVIDFTLNIRL